jgi:membrane-bound inhibitor of C-type lysozyme
MLARARGREQGMVGAVRAGLAALLATLAAAATQAPVNPDVRVVTYACKDGSTVVAGYPDAQTAVVTWKSHAYSLKLSRSASGARYTGYGLQWWTKGAQGTLARLRTGEEITGGPALACTAQPDKGAAKI